MEVSSEEEVESGTNTHTAHLFPALLWAGDAHVGAALEGKGVSGDALGRGQDAGGEWSSLLCLHGGGRGDACGF